MCLIVANPSIFKDFHKVAQRLFPCFRLYEVVHNYGRYTYVSARILGSDEPKGNDLSLGYNKKLLAVINILRLIDFSFSSSSFHVGWLVGWPEPPLNPWG